MKVSVKWLKSMVDVPSNLQEFTTRLDMTGTAVEDVAVVGAAFEGVVVGQILTRERHPNAEKLWLTTVDVGNHNLGDDDLPKPLQIVCGAQNFEAGDKVPVALVGTVLPDGNQITKAKIRGVESFGMNCSARELNLGQDHQGIMILDPSAPIGVPFAAYIDSSDSVIDLEITPNRADCMSMLGVAREVGAIYQAPYRVGRVIPAPPVDESVDKLVKVSIDSPERCPRYTARVIKGVKIGPSPDWLAERVTAAGARSINNIVDAANYIMFELGQPLHTFDLDTLAKDKEGKAHIIVRAAKDGENLVTLDGITRKLDSDITCIVDGNAANGKGATIALAGVMGGLDSEVTEKTTNILLESASFSTTHTSRTGRKLQLFSEASARFERRVDCATCDEFSARAAALMVEVAGGTVCEGVVDVYPAPAVQPTLIVRMQRLCDFVGATITAQEAQQILVALGCEVSLTKDASDLQKDASDLQVTPPSFRPDLTREIDLYEEVLRVWGMDRVEPTLPGGRERIGEKTLDQQRLEVVGRALRTLGLNETMTYVFVSSEHNAALQMPFDDNQQAVELVNPMNSEQGFLRRSIFPGLLRSLANNQNHGVSNVQLYETGAVFFAAEGRKLPKERQMLAAVMGGSWSQPGWNDPATPIDFFDGKGVVENLLRELNITKLRFKPLEDNQAQWLQPGRAAEVYAGSACLGWLGEVHPLVCSAYDAAAPVVAFELDLKTLLSAAQHMRPYKDVPQYPAVELDLALIVREDVTAEKITQVISSAAGALLDAVRLFDVYRDTEKIGDGLKSLAFALSYRAPDRTLTLEEVEKLHSKVVGKVASATGAKLR